MRVAAVSLLVLAACSEEGAHLTLHAPDGPGKAASFQVVLASPSLVPVIANQRVSPKATQQETVTYYLQRTAADGASETIDGVDGFTVLVEPDRSIAETTFIPFVLLYDDASHLVGVATYEPDPQNPAPAPILVQHGEIDKYTLEVEPLAEVADTAPVAAGDAMQVTCARDDQTTFVSGVVWRPRVGGELRLMLPDNPTSDDATQRDLDLDCDQHPVAQDGSGSDCDDTRARFHAGAKEQCDGEDWNCDGLQYAVVPCTGAGLCTTNTSGFALCDDTTGMLGTCSSDVACVCASNPSSTACARCILADAHGAAAGEVTPCQPGVGMLSTSGTCEASPCVVQVVGQRGGWDLGVAATVQGPFAPSVAGITGSFALRARSTDGPGASIAGTPGGSIGVADLVIIPTNGNPPRWLSVDLEAATQQTTCTGNGPFSMTCSP